MYNSLKDKIQSAQRSLGSVIETIDDLPKLEALNDLMTVLDIWDYRYKEHCTMVDEDNGLEEGTTYNADFGESIEYYVECDDMHSLSKAFRALKQP